LLSGRPPFDGSDDREIVKNVKIGNYSFSGSEWKNISRDAIDFIKKMLTYDPANRIAAAEALNHIWIKKKVAEPSDPKATLNALQNLRTFRVNFSFYEYLILTNFLILGRTKNATGRYHLYC
jgi:calcium-dependent protein kinase